MAEEEKAPSTTDSESLIQVSPEFADVLSAIVGRRTKSQAPDVEGHAMSVEEFSAEGRIDNTVCGVIYVSD
jgi:hypothetical protein